MIIVTCRIYPKDIEPSYKEESYVFDNSHQLKDFLVSQVSVIVYNVFVFKADNNGKEDA